MLSKRWSEKEILGVVDTIAGDLCALEWGNCCDYDKGRDVFYWSIRRTKGKSFVCKVPLTGRSLAFLRTGLCEKKEVSRSQLGRFMRTLCETHIRRTDRWRH